MKTCTKLDAGQGRSRLQCIWRIVNDDDTVQWEVWTACENVNAPYHEMKGTCLVLHNDGMVTRVTERGDAFVDMIDVMPAVGESE